MLLASFRFYVAQTPTKKEIRHPNMRAASMMVSLMAPLLTTFPSTVGNSGNQDDAEPSAQYVGKRFWRNKMWSTRT